MNEILIRFAYLIFSILAFAILGYFVLNVLYFANKMVYKMFEKKKKK